jgi:hypothetical protein
MMFAKWKRLLFVWGYLLVIGCGIGTDFSTMANGQTVDQLEWTSPIAMPTLSGEELIAARLDDTVYASTRLGFPDVRLFSDTGDEVAFVMRRARGKQSMVEKRTWLPTDISLKVLDNNGLQVIFQVDTEEYPRWPAAIRLVSPLVRFEHGVRLESSTNGTDWEFLAEQTIFDYSQFMNVRDTEIRLPKLDAENDKTVPKSYRLTINDVTQEQQSQLMELTRNLQQGNETQRQERTTINRQPFRIDQIELWNEEYQRDVPADLEVNHELTIDRLETVRDTKETRIYLTSGRQPLVAIKIETGNRNFSRRARLEVLDNDNPRVESSSTDGSTTGATDAARNDDRHWHALTSGRLSSIDFRTLKSEDLLLKFNESRLTHYRLVIRNGDSTPLEVTRVVGIGPAYDAVFLAHPDAKYQVNFGNSTVVAPAYDTTVLDAAMSEGFLPKVATLEAASKLNVIPAPAEPLFLRAIRSRVFVAVVIVGLVGALGFGLWNASRRLETL